MSDTDYLKQKAAVESMHLMGDLGTELCDAIDAGDVPEWVEVKLQELGIAGMKLAECYKVLHDHVRQLEGTIRLSRDQGCLRVDLPRGRLSPEIRSFLEAERTRLALMVALVFPEPEDASAPLKVV